VGDDRLFFWGPKKSPFVATNERVSRAMKKLGIPKKHDLGRLLISS
jgi:hypothetical protein